MTKTTLIAAAAAAVALPAVASAQDEFTLFVDPNTGDVLIDADVPFAGFTFTSDSSALLPENLPYLAGNPALGLVQLSPTVIFNTLSTTANDISAGTTGTAAPAGAYDLGRVVDLSSLSTSPQSGLDIVYLSDGNVVLPGIVVIPEPATAGLLGAVALGMLRRRRAA